METTQQNDMLWESQERTALRDRELFVQECLERYKSQKQMDSEEKTSQKPQPAIR